MIPMQVYNTSFGHRMETSPPRGPGGPPSMFSSVDSGRSRIIRQYPPRGHRRRFPALMVGSSWISNSDTSQGPRHRHFLVLMVDDLGSLAPTPPRGPPSMFSCIHGGRSQITSSGTSQGPIIDVFCVHGGTSGSPTPAPPRVSSSTFSSLDSGRSRISSSSNS
jgi:hypothetical protein